MKKLIVILAMLLATTANAETRLGLGASTDMLTNARNPVLGLVSIEKNPVRLSLAFGAHGATQGNLDLLARSRSGVYGGAGLFVERFGAVSSDISSSSSDTTTTKKPHDSGRHIGDRHVRGGKLIVSTSNSAMRSVTIGGEEYGLSPALVLGVGARNVGLFAEGRVILGGMGRGQFALGFRF